MQLNDKAEAMLVAEMKTDTLVAEIQRRGIYGVLWEKGKGIIMCTEMPEDLARAASVLNV